MGPKVSGCGHQISKAPNTPSPCRLPAPPRSTPSLAPSGLLLSSAPCLSLALRFAEEILLLPAPKHIHDPTSSAPSRPPGLVFNQMSPSQGLPDCRLTMYCPHPPYTPSTALFPWFLFLLLQHPTYTYLNVFCILSICPSRNKDPVSRVCLLGPHASTVSSRNAP